MITVTDIIPTIADGDASALAVARAEALFGQDNLRSSASFAASVHERVVDYLEQAPVLAVAIAHGGGLLNGGNRNKLYAAHKLTALCERGARLKEVMRAYGLPAPLRALKAEALAAYHISAVLGLATLNPSTIAQAIPKSNTAQRRWLAAICAWRERLIHCRRSPDMLMHWAALEIARNRVDHRRAEDLADFAARGDVPLNPAWDWKRAEAASTDWHDRITAGGAEAKFGVMAHQVVCFAPHPDLDVVDGFEFVALRTPAAVYAEGQAMRHCVGSYVADVVSGQSAIISVRHDERRVATLELRGGRVAQLKARFNGTPSVAVQRATKSYHHKLRVAAANRSKAA